MKTLFTVVILFFALSFAVYAQEDIDPGNKNVIKLTGSDSPLLISAVNKDYADIVKKIWQALPKDELQKFGPYNPEANTYILFVGIEDINEFHIVHTEDGEPTERITDEKNVFLLWVDDRIDDDYEITYEIKERQSALQRDFQSMKSWLSGFKTRGGEQKTFTYYSKVIKLENMVVPSDISVNLNVFRDGKERSVHTAGYINHEVSWYNVAVGVSATPGKEKSFLVKDQQLFLSDKAKSEWAGLFILGFNLHFNRDVDNWSPSYKFWEKNFWNDFHKRLNFFGGLEISTRPLDNLFTGIGINITRDIQLSGGVVWKNQSIFANGENVGAINSLDDIKELLPSKYEPSFYAGLTFSTGMITKMLGLN